SPWCSGCHWEQPGLTPGPFGCVEVWNSGWDSYSNNERALQLYYLWLNRGARLTATSGSDSHGPWAGTGSRIGFNHVRSRELSSAAILGALARGRSYISSGPTLEVAARAHGFGRAVTLG